MFTRRVTTQNQAYWASSLLDDLGIDHAFASRAWDVKTTADVQHIAHALQWATQSTDDAVVMSKQVHGCAVTSPHTPLAEADAHVTDQPGRTLAVRTADCVPILLATADGGAVAAVHAGWRGLLADVIQRAVDALLALGHGPPEAAAVGPCISAARYEVGPEVAEPFRHHGPAVVRDDLGDRPHLDIGLAAVTQLRNAGLGPRQIDRWVGCTFDDTADCFSFRRDGKGVGHLAALIRPVKIL